MKNVLAALAVATAGPGFAYEVDVSGEFRLHFHTTDEETSTTGALDINMIAPFGEIAAVELGGSFDLSGPDADYYLIQEDRGVAYASVNVDTGLGVLKVGRPRDLFTEHLDFMPFVDRSFSKAFTGASEFGFSLPILHSFAFSDIWADQNDFVGLTFAGQSGGLIYGLGVTEETSGSKDTYRQILLGYEWDAYRVYVGFEEAVQDEETARFIAAFADWGNVRAEAMLRELDFGFVQETVTHIGVQYDPMEELTLGLSYTNWNTDFPDVQDPFSTASIEYRPEERVFVKVARDISFVTDDPVTSVTVGVRLNP